MRDMRRQCWVCASHSTVRTYSEIDVRRLWPILPVLAEVGRVHIGRFELISSLHLAEHNDSLIGKARSLAEIDRVQDVCRAWIQGRQYDFHESVDTAQRLPLPAA